MENLLGLSIAAGFLLSIFMMMIIKNLTRMVYTKAKELDSLREQFFKYQHTDKITGEDAWQQVLVLEDTVLGLRYDSTRMDEMRIKLANHKERINVLEDNLVHQENVICAGDRLTRLENEFDKLEGELSFQVERISDDCYIEDIEIYDWVAARDSEFANSCKVSYRYTPKGILKEEYSS